MAKAGTLTVKVLGDSTDFSKKMKGLGPAAAAGIALAGAAVATGLFQIGSEFDKQFDKIRVGTGATGEALKGLEGSFKNVLKTVPASFDDAGTAIADLNTRLGLSGGELEDVAGQFLNLSRITGTDVATNVDNLTRVFGDWGVAAGDIPFTLDNIYRASQASGIGIDDLSTSMVQFGAPLRNLGFGIEESMALLAQFNKTGVNTEAVFAGLKIGVGTLAKAGEQVPETFRRVVAEITELGPGSEATAKAIELFGQRAGPDLADAIAGGKFQVEEMLAAITGGTDTIAQAAKDTEDFGEKWTLLKNRVFVALQPVATKFFDAVGGGMDRLGEAFTDLLPSLKLFWNALRTGFTEDEGTKIERIALTIRDAGMKLGRFVTGTLIPAMQEIGEVIVTKVLPTLLRFGQWLTRNKPILIGVAAAIAVGLVAAFTSWAIAAGAAAAATIAAAAPVIAIGVAIAGVVAALVWAYDNWTLFRTVVDGVARFVRDAVIPAMAALARIFTDKVLPAIAGVFNWIKSNWKLVLGFLTGPIGLAVVAIAEHWDKIKTGASAIVDFFRNMPGRITAATRGMWDGIKSAFVSVVNALISIWNGLDFTLPEIKTPLGTIGGGTVGVPDIPLIPTGGGSSSPTIRYGGAMAHGGLATHPMLAQIGDAGIGDPEVVSPESLMRKIVREESGKIFREESGRTGGTEVIQVVLDRRVIAEAIRSHERALR